MPEKYIKTVLPRETLGKVNSRTVRGKPSMVVGTITQHSRSEADPEFRLSSWELAGQPVCYIKALCFCFD